MNELKHTVQSFLHNRLLTEKGSKILIGVGGAIILYCLLRPA